MKNKWIHISEENETSELFSLRNEHLEFPFEYLPKAEILTLNELERLEQLESENNGFKNGGEFYEMVMLKYRRGPSEYCHDKRRKDLVKIIDECKIQNISLPSNFIKLMKTDTYVSRLRLGFGEIDLSDGIVPFENNNDSFLITFIKDSQECCFWYLLVDKDGSHKVLYNAHHWSNHLKIVDENDDPFEYYICANSIEEFIVRLSCEIRFKEKK